ncbi:MAG TPA: hypothetical protein VFV38_04030 [Ktedonobacteraceae bacterium]|nr:hypothetical protein [Ktedonobacteraceae bacterium]
MQSTCPRCGSVSTTSSQFCTNCGNTLQATQSYQQSWQAPSAQGQTQPPSWAQAPGNVYQGNSNQNMGFGFGGQNDAQAKKLLQIVGIVILSAVLLLIVCIALAIVIPIPGVRSFFLIVALLLVLIPWIIYNRIRRYMRRTFGSFRRFF